MSPKNFIFLRFVCFALLWIRVTLRFTLMMTSQFPRPGDGFSAHTLWTRDHSPSIPCSPYKYLYSIHFAKYMYFWLVQILFELVAIPHPSLEAKMVEKWDLPILPIEVYAALVGACQLHSKIFLWWWIYLWNRDPSLFISWSPEKM